MELIVDRQLLKFTVFLIQIIFKSHVPLHFISIDASRHISLVTLIVMILAAIIVQLALIDPLLYQRSQY